MKHFAITGIVGLIILQASHGLGAEEKPDVVIVNESLGIKNVNIAIGENNTARSGSIKLKNLRELLLTDQKAIR